MILSEKLLALRTRAGLSQEELAEKLNVSRQSVSKWESGGSIPGIDKILEMSRLYGISTDYLLKDELEELPGEIVADLYQPTPVRELALEDVNAYLDTLRDSAGGIALGVALCILSPVALLLFLGLHEMGLIFSTDSLASGLGCGVLLVVVAAAVALFIRHGLRLHEFEFLETEDFRLDYGVAGIVEKEAREFQPQFGRGLAFGVVLCIMSVIPLLLAGALDAADGICICMCALLLALAALGVFRIVRVCIQKGGYDRLLQRGDYTEEKKAEDRRLQVFDTAYWCIVTAVYLSISFCFMIWQISWIIWPVAGVVFAAARAIAAARMRR